MDYFKKYEKEAFTVISSIFFTAFLIFFIAVIFIICNQEEVYEIIGQKQALLKTNQLIKTRQHSNKIIATFFIGPSGTGKSTAAKYMAQNLKGNAIIIDCANMSVPEIFGYSTESSDNKAGALDMYNNNTKVIVFDKFDQSFELNKLLSKLKSAIKAGGIVTCCGKQIDFNNVVLIFISNKNDILTDPKFKFILSKSHIFSDEMRFVEFKREPIYDTKSLEKMIGIRKMKDWRIGSLTLSFSMLKYYNDHIEKESFDVRDLKNEIENQVKAFVNSAILKCDQDLFHYFNSNEYKIRIKDYKDYEIVGFIAMKKTQAYKNISVKVIYENGHIKCVYQDYVEKRNTENNNIVNNITVNVNNII